MYSDNDTSCSHDVGSPIRKSPDHRLLASPRSLSQLATSFIAFVRQGIHTHALSSLTIKFTQNTCLPPSCDGRRLMVASGSRPASHTYPSSFQTRVFRKTFIAAGGATLFAYLLYSRALDGACYIARQNILLSNNCTNLL